MQTISIDIETFSSVDLKKCGVYKYAEAPDFEILLFGYSADGGERIVIDLASGDALPQEIIDALTDDSVTKWAFNAQFERVCLSRYLRDMDVRLDPFADNHHSAAVLGKAQFLILAFVQHQRNHIFYLTNKFSIVSNYYERLRILEQERQAEQQGQHETAKIWQEELRAQQAKTIEAIREAERVRSTLTEKINRLEEEHLQERDKILTYERCIAELEKQIAENNGDSFDDNSNENSDSADSTYEELSD